MKNKIFYILLFLLFKKDLLFAQITANCPPLTVYVSKTDVTCFAYNDGTASVDSVIGGSGCYTYHWTDPDSSTTPFVDSLAPGIYTVIVWDTCAGLTCEAMIQINQPQPLSYTISKQNPSCPYTCNGYAVVNPTGGTSSYLISWSNVNSPLPKYGDSIYNVCPDTFLLNISDMNNCNISDTIIFKPVKDTSIVIKLNTTTYCENEPFDTLSAYGTSPAGGLWYASDTSIVNDTLGVFAPFIAKAGLTEIYYLIIDTPCYFIDSVELTIYPVPSVTLTTNLLDNYCNNDTAVPLSATPQGGAFGVTYKKDTIWKDTILGLNNVYFNPSLYLDSVIVWYAKQNIFGCIGRDFDITFIYPAPQPPIVYDTSFCEGENIFVYASAQSSIDSILWYSDENLTNFISANDTLYPQNLIAGNNSFYVIAKNKWCKSNLSVSNIFYEDHTIVDAGKEQNICVGDSAVLTATGGTNYHWLVNTNDSNSSSIIVYPKQSQYYYVNISTSLSCIFTDSVLVNVNNNDNCLLNIYTGITPNGDGNNDTWIIKGIEHWADNKVTIFNRWGDIVRTFNGYNNKDIVWDGKSNKGLDLPDGTYFYIIEIPGYNDFKGWIELLR